tara:strand:- start:7804 stop:8001 length:198 start_codon:yes stop_codon:yes gene_type:complete
MNTYECFDLLLRAGLSCIELGAFSTPWHDPDDDTLHIIFRNVDNDYVEDTHGIVWHVPDLVETAI